MERYTTAGRIEITVNFRQVEFVSVGPDGRAVIYFASGAVRSVNEAPEHVLAAFEKSFL